MAELTRLDYLDSEDITSMDSSVLGALVETPDNFIVAVAKCSF
jgi:hypothetical protein